MPNLKDFALNMINSNPQIANNPNAQEFLNVIRNGDDTRGRQIAQNLCDRYGRPFNQFRKAKRHYTQTHSPEDKEKMREHANEHMMETMSTIREIYDNADPELKKRMKADLTKLTGEMTV